MPFPGGERAVLSTGDDAVYKELVDCQQDLIVKFSPEGRLLFVNPAYCAAVGKTKEELTGSVFMPVTSERYSDIMATQMTRLFRPPFACTVEQWLPSPQGLRCISWSAKSILDTNGRVSAIVAIGRDITRLRQEQRAIRRRHDDLLLVVESGKQMYYTHSPDHVMMYVSPRLRALLGCHLHVGKRLWTDYLTDNPVNTQGLERTLRAIATGRREPSYRLELAGCEGARIWVEVDEIPVVQDGRTIAIAGSIVDITEKKQVDEGIIEAEILLKGSRGEKSGSGDTEKSSRRLFRSIFTPPPDDDQEEDVFAGVPTNIR
jgi:PAS domain S-box-containing protein